MQKVLAIILISLHSFANTELNQLLKLPELVQHYQKTCASDRSINFFDFLSMHYCGEDGNTEDDTEDRQLPFMNFHQCLTAAIVPDNPTSFSMIDRPYSSKEFGSYRCISESSGFSNSLLRPPCV